MTHTWDITQGGAPMGIKACLSHTRSRGITAVVSHTRSRGITAVVSDDSAGGTRRVGATCMTTVMT